VKQLRKKHNGPHDGFYTSVVGLNSKKGIAFIFALGVGTSGILGTTAAGTPRLYCITRPNTGRSPKYESLNDIRQRFQPVTGDEAENLWKEQFQGLKQSVYGV
jgi:hypothetical protein